MYTCVAINVAGTSSSSASLTVSGKRAVINSHQLFFFATYEFFLNFFWVCNWPTLTVISQTLPGAPDDDSEIIWKSSFESYYTEITELGRYGRHFEVLPCYWSIPSVWPSSLLTRGRFSVTKRCDQRGSKRTVAAKHVNKKLLRRERVLKEVRLLQALDHPNLVKLLDTYETANSYVLILEMWVQQLLLLLCHCF